jgi:membrane protein implicated in regulation of membrane protease activity
MVGMVVLIGLVWQAVTFLGLIVVVPILIAAILGRKEKRDIRKDAQGDGK